MIRTLQDHGIHRGIDFHMEYTVFRLLLDDGRVSGALAYDRERGRFRVYRAKSVVLATGGIGRAFKITSNSWEYTGDGHTLAYDAGADLIDMEFVQFHPTGMVWPPSVRGILVTEGVRGEGGILLNSDGERFMFDDIPPLYKDQTADSAEEGWRYVVGDRDARRPPELLTRDHVARCIVDQIKAGKGSPHGGVYLDIAWIKEKIGNSEEHIRKKLPSMYHQFKELAGLDITKERMEVRPDDALCDGRRAGRRGKPDVLRAGSVRRRRVRGGAPRGQPAGRQLALRPARLRQAGGRVRGRGTISPKDAGRMFRQRGAHVRPSCFLRGCGILFGRCNGGRLHHPTTGVRQILRRTMCSASFPSGVLLQHRGRAPETVPVSRGLPSP